MTDQISDKDELLFRQVHPNFVDAGELSSAAFRPTAKDNGQLSVDRSSLTTSEASYRLHTVSKGLSSAGTYAVSVGDFSEVEVTCYPDPIAAIGDQPYNAAHAYGDFTKLSSGRQKTAAKRLRNRAASRGCLHPQDNEKDSEPASPDITTSAPKPT